ncbi:helix-turn-helix transcriptional regulator [Halegenticoccus tardaugens]|uniref:helix-turn-helix transcriptional regulator n=1 Tax=Halegenticoccus tardaugens TaxID=2071624 RepID=UPI00100B2EA9|nr:helix-turn-helix domain-containing protein [Halegenticoccus tardaugens]
MEKPGAFAVVLLLAVLCVASPVIAADGDPADSRIHQTTNTTQGDAEATDVQDSFDRDRVILVVHDNQSARWTFQYERTLENDSDERDFRAFAREFNNQETELYTGFQNDSQTLVRDGSNVTGREMEATDFSRQAYVTSSLGNDIGVVEMSFTWTNFAETDDDRIVVGDVFEGGLYISPNQSLVVEPGPNLVFESVNPNGTQSNTTSLGESDSVTWQGEREFTDNRPQVVFAPNESGVGSEPAPNETRTDGLGPDQGRSMPGGDAGMWLLGALVVVLGGVAAAFWYGRSSNGEGTAPTVAGPSERRSEPTPPAQPAVSDSELLSDEDRVISMLRERGGRMKQVKIVEETGWSKSKVSMLLSDMEEEGLISKLRVGRENVISLRGHEPEAAGSPFDDE